MIQVTLPQLSLAMEEAKISRWLVADGQLVSSGQPIAEIETDKAVSEVTAPIAGTIRHIAAEGALVAVESPIAEIVEGETPRAPTTAAQTAEVDSTSDANPAPSDTPPLGFTAPAMTTMADRKHRGSPAARRIAKERGIDLARPSGSGPEGRVTIRDLQSSGSESKSPLRGAVIAHLVASWRDIPHIHIAGELDGTGLAAAKRAAPIGVTLTDFLILVTVRALREVPELNGSIGRPSQAAHVALAVATPVGVVAPVIRNANDKSLAEIASDRARLVAAARSGKSDRRDLAGGTITITNLGAYPVDFFAPVVSGPQIAMLATGRLSQRPVAVNGAVVIRHQIWMNVGIDHRGADGISGARFLAALEGCMNDFSTRPM